jgi:response regulator RpfG family c-di-GMP phosphodiesterase
MPDVVVTDVMMPGIDGLELCRRVKNNPATRLTPVVMVTSLGEREHPDGLQGDDIPLLAQITGIVDVYDALTSDRPYRKALTEEAALEELRQEARRGWRRADLVDEFTAICADGRLKRLIDSTAPPALSVR